MTYDTKIEQFKKLAIEALNSTDYVTSWSISEIELHESGTITAIAQDSNHSSNVLNIELYDNRIIIE